MSIQLNIGEMLEVLRELDDDVAQAFEDRIVVVCHEMARVIADMTGTFCNTSQLEFWGGELMVGFSGIGPIPQTLRGYDDEGWS